MSGAPANGSWTVSDYADMRYHGPARSTFQQMMRGARSRVFNTVVMGRPDPSALDHATLRPLLDELNDVGITMYFTGRDASAEGSRG